MNGRIYDPKIGRFLSADPFVQFPESTQGYNRYTYVGNNPLTYTDPSGYFLKDLVKTAIGVVAMVYLGPIAGGAISGYLSTGTLKGAVLGMMAGAIANGIGSGFESLAAGQGGALTAGQVFGKALAHGVSQGALSKAGGGRFGDGFLGGFSSSLLGPTLKRAGPIGGTMIAATVGGTLSVIGGGKFKNGAVSGAFVHAFNELMHGAMEHAKRELTAEEYLDTLDKALANTNEMIDYLEVASPEELAGMMPEAWPKTAENGNPFSTGRDSLDLDKINNLRKEYLRQLEGLKTDVLLERSRTVAVMALGGTPESAMYSTLTVSKNTRMSIAGHAAGTVSGIKSLLIAAPNPNIGNRFTAPYIAPACGGGSCALNYVGY